VGLNDDNLIFAKQIGVTHIIAHAPLPVGEGYWDFLDLLRLRKYIEKFGLRLGVIENLPLLHMDKILLGEEGKDKQAENIKKTINNMGKAGIKYLGIAFMIAGVWGHWRTGESGGGRGDAGITSFDYNYIENAPFIPKGEFWGNCRADYYNDKNLLGTISKQKIWERFVWFLDKIIPSAEESDIKICVHPSDPPAPKLRGIENILNDVNDFKKMIEIFPSNCLGLDFCQGTFTEMEGVGKNVLEIINYFGKKRKIFYVHFRNIKGTFPKYDEVFIDDGDIDMVEALKMYHKIGFKGILTPDHTPLIKCGSPWHTGMAFAVGYVKGIIKAFNLK